MSQNELVEISSNYKTYDGFLSRIRYARVVLNNVTGSSVPLSLSATQLIEFKIPAKTVINLSKSFLTYQYTVPALANNYGVSFEDNQDFCQWLYMGEGGV